MRTVISDPHIKVPKAPSTPSAPNSSFEISGTSPMMTISGTSTPTLSRFVYQLKWSALPPTTSRAFFITTEWTAVTLEEITPRETPIMERGTESRKTPTKKPRVTIPQAPRMEREGRECRNT